MRHEFIFFKAIYCCEKSIARSRLNQNPTLIILHFQILKKKIDAAHFLDARGIEKQVSNLEWPKLCIAEFVGTCR